MRSDASPGWGEYALAVVDSEEFTVAFLAAMGLLVAGLPAAAQCVDHVGRGDLATGCLVGVIGLGVVAVCGTKLVTAGRRVRRRYR